MFNLSIRETIELLKSRKLSVRELTKYYLDRIDGKDKAINSYITVNPKALNQADNLDQKINKGEDLGPLMGVPFGVKDMFCTKGLRTTAASKILSNFVPPYDATVVARLKASGALILGKVNQDEFAMGSSSETSHFGSVRNPWNLEYVAGGSSGGSAAALSANLCLASLGTDTGGSIRQPASFCGVIGLKPTYGRVSRYGIISYASSLDQAGPMGHCVEDVALVLESMAGRDHLDSTTSDRPVEKWATHLNPKMKGLRVGLIKEFESDSIDSDVLSTFERAKTSLASLGARIQEVSIPLVKYGIPVYYLIAASEASSNLSRYDGVKFGYRSNFQNLSAVELERFYGQTRAEGFGVEVQRRIILGTYCLSSGYFDAYYNKASKVRRLMRDQYREVFKTCDVILAPVTASPAFRLGEKISDPLAMYFNDIFTTTTNLAGLPGISVPFGKSAEGLPIGVQLMADLYQEQKLLNVALALEQVSCAKGARPNVP